MTRKAKKAGADQFANSSRRSSISPTQRPFWDISQAARRLMMPSILDGGAFNRERGDQISGTGLMLESIDAWCNDVAASANSARFPTAAEYWAFIEKSFEHRILELPTLFGLGRSCHDSKTVEAAVHLRNEIVHPFVRQVAPTGRDRELLRKLCEYGGIADLSALDWHNPAELIRGWDGVHEWCWREMQTLVTSLASAIEPAVRAHPYFFADSAFGLADPFQTGIPRRLIHPFSCEPGWRGLPYGLIDPVAAS